MQSVQKSDCCFDSDFAVVVFRCVVVLGIKTKTIATIATESSLITLLPSSERVQLSRHHNSTLDIHSPIRSSPSFTDYDCNSDCSKISSIIFLGLLLSPFACTVLHSSFPFL